MNGEESLWEAIRTLWMKYCGISDEYKMLKHRWRYLYDPESLSALPKLFGEEDEEEDNSTFGLLDNLVEDINETFTTKLNFKRSEPETYNKSLRYLRNFALRDYYILERQIFELSTFVGLLKIAFFQRTVSKEMSHVASGLPHSPERTIGNELFYLAADEVAKSYYSCFRIPYGRWDEFITFTPPITEGHFTGAFFRASEYTRLFHISMSEEQKYFVGAYMILAHELGHAPTVKLWKGLNYAKTNISLWIKLLFSEIYNKTMSVLWKRRRINCDECALWRRYALKIELEQCIADVLGSKVAGPNMGHALLDTTFGTSNESDLIRILTFRSYMIASGVVDSTLNLRIEDLKNRVNENLNCPSFFECVEEIGNSWASLINDFDLRFPQIFTEQLDTNDNIVNLLDLCPEAPVIDINIIGSRGNWTNLHDICAAIADDRGLKLNCNQICINRSLESLFSCFVVDEFDEDNIKANGKKITTDNIKDSLLKGVLCPEIDPRYILHAYYECYKESKGMERPDYAATIHSLVFNKFNKNRK